MNKVQRIILTAGVIFISLLLLIPPWKYFYTERREKAERSAGYHFIFATPSLKDHEAIRNAFSFPKEINERNFQVRIDTTRLFVQCAFALLAMVGLLIAFYRH